MPIYEYQCKTCCHEFEVIVQGSKKPVCPSCGSAKLDKRFSTFAVSAAQPVSMPSPCQTCGHPGGPGACALS